MVCKQKHQKKTWELYPDNQNMLINVVTTKKLRLQLAYTVFLNPQNRRRRAFIVAQAVLSKNGPRFFGFV